MKKGIVTVPYDEEKLGALQMYLRDKGKNLEEEVQKSMDQLYEKSVPLKVREFIDLRAEEASQEPRYVRRTKVEKETPEEIPNE